MARLKKDIDRELMYKKILPTAMSSENAFDKAAFNNKKEEILPLNSPPATVEVSIQKPVEVIVSSPNDEERTQEENAQVLPVQFQPEVAAKTEVSSPEAAPLSIQTATVSTEPPLVNLMEAFVEKRLDAALKKFKCCTCDRCRKDVLAIALNKLPPLYVIEADPDIRDLHERERAAQVATALVQAILAIKAHPSHEISH